MKNLLIKSLLLLSLMFLVYACADDDDVLEISEVVPEEVMDDESLFKIHVLLQGFSTDLYVMVTAPLTGEVLYWDATTSFVGDITFDAGDLETVDVTFGGDYNSYFSLKTFRDVQSGFKLSGLLNDCYEGQYVIDTLTQKSVEIIFPGTKEIIEIINPAYDYAGLQTTGNVTIDQENKIVYDFDNNITIVKGNLGRTNLNHQFVFRFQGEQEYKSIVVKRSDWVKVDNFNYKLELEMEDLQPCSAHYTNLGRVDTRLVNSEIITSTGDRIAIAKWSHIAHNQTGLTIKIFLQNDLEVDQLLLKVRSNRVDEGFQFQRYFDNTSNSINLEEHVTELTDITPNTYTYSTDDSYGLVKTTYEYLTNNVISSWSIYQQPNSTLAYTLPAIKSEYLNTTIGMLSNLSTPYNFRIQFYSLEEDINQSYHESQIDKQLECLDFNSSYSSFEF